MPWILKARADKGLFHGSRLSLPLCRLPYHQIRSKVAAAITAPTTPALLKLVMTSLQPIRAVAGMNAAFVARENIVRDARESRAPCNNV